MPLCGCGRAQSLTRALDELWALFQKDHMFRVPKVSSCDGNNTIMVPSYQSSYMAVMSRIVKLASRDYDNYSPSITRALLERDWLLDTDDGGGCSNLSTLNGHRGTVQHMSHACFVKTFCELAQLWTRSTDEDQWAGTSRSM